ncbi:MAG TPA: hypothetical protein VFM10_11420, partial [Terriglobales bacterium]|nr:hypothetical protein [Terriglobales bacterium]
MATSIPSYTPEIAQAVAEMGLQTMESEFSTTKKVIAAVTNPDFKLDEKSRTAIEQAWHIASADVQLLEDIGDMKFDTEERYKEQPKTIAEIVAWYDKKSPEA